MGALLSSPEPENTCYHRKSGRAVSNHDQCAYGTPFPIDGQEIAVEIVNNDNGSKIDVVEHCGFKVTTEWDADNLKDVVEEKMGVHTGCLELRLQGTKLNRTIKEALGSGGTPRKLRISVIIDHSKFPEKHPSFNCSTVPLHGQDFKLPNWRGGLPDDDFIWEITTERVRQYGLVGDGNDAIRVSASPVHTITMPETDRSVANIPDDAVAFAWSYPATAACVGDTDCFGLETWVEPEDALKVQSFFTHGGFIYFDAAHEVTFANTIGQTTSDVGIVFGRPSRWHAEANEALFQRWRPVTIKMLADMGAAHYCWLRPGEQLHDANGDLLPDEMQPDVPHGGFAYLFHQDILEKNEFERRLDRYFPVVEQPKGDTADQSKSTDVFKAFAANVRKDSDPDTFFEYGQQSASFSMVYSGAR